MHAHAGRQAYADSSAAAAVNNGRTAARTRLLSLLLAAQNAAVGLILVLPRVVRGATATTKALLADRQEASGIWTQSHPL